MQTEYIATIGKTKEYNGKMRYYGKAVARI